MEISLKPNIHEVRYIFVRGFLSTKQNLPSEDCLPELTIIKFATPATGVFLLVDQNTSRNYKLNKNSLDALSFILPVSQYIDTI